MAHPSSAATEAVMLVSIHRICMSRTYIRAALDASTHVGAC